MSLADAREILKSHHETKVGALEREIANLNDLVDELLSDISDLNDEICSCRQAEMRELLGVWLNADTDDTYTLVAEATEKLLKEMG